MIYFVKSFHNNAFALREHTVAHSAVLQLLYPGYETSRLYMYSYTKLYTYRLSKAVLCWNSRGWGKPTAVRNILVNSNKMVIISY